MDQSIRARRAARKASAAVKRARASSSGCGEPLPPQPIRVLWGDRDRVLGPGLRRQADALLGDRILPVPQCGHLPHLDQPTLVRDQLFDLQTHAPSA